MRDAPRFIPVWRCASIRVFDAWAGVRAVAPVRIASIELCWRWRGHRGKHSGRMFGATDTDEGKKT